MKLTLYVLAYQTPSDIVIHIYWLLLVLNIPVQQGEDVVHVVAYVSIELCHSKLTKSVIFFTI